MQISAVQFVYGNGQMVPGLGLSNLYIWKNPRVYLMMYDVSDPTKSMYMKYVIILDNI